MHAAAAADCAPRSSPEPWPAGDQPRARRAQISAVGWMFSYPLRTALAVGLSMAQIGEFAFVLLSVASHQGLLAYQVYMLLMGAPAAPWRRARLPAPSGAKRSAPHSSPALPCTPPRRPGCRARL